MATRAAFCSASFFRGSVFAASLFLFDEYGATEFVAAGTVFFRVEHDLYLVFLPPFNQAAFVIGVYRHQILDVEEIGKDEFLDETLGAGKALVQEYGADKGFEYVTIDMFVAGDVRAGNDRLVQAELDRQVVQGFPADDFGAHPREKPLVFVGKEFVKQFGDNGTEHGIAQKFKPLVVQDDPGSRHPGCRAVEKSQLVKSFVLGHEAQLVK